MIVFCKRIVQLLAIASLVGCAATEKVNVAETLAPLPPDCQPITYRDTNPPPAGYRVVGQVKYGDSGFSVSCGKDTVTERLRQQACNAGANGIRVTKEKGLDLWSSCYRVEAELISVPGEGSR